MYEPPLQSMHVSGRTRNGGFRVAQVVAAAEQADTSLEKNAPQI